MNEIYLYKKNPNEGQTINVGLSYPSTYYYGMSVLGYLSLFKEFDKNEHVCAQRIFLNSKMLAFEPKHLDILGFSCVFELDILQILKILKKYGFNLNAQKRKKKIPLIFAGGPVITSNPEPFANFFDFMIIGDGEGTAKEITETYIKNKNKPKTEILKELSKVNGIYVPSLYKTKYNHQKIQSFIPISNDTVRFVKKRTTISSKCLYSPIISENTFYSNTVFIELARGCPFECKFCTAHWQNQPTRFYELKHIKKAIKKASKHAKKIVFIGAMISLHPDFDEICLYLSKLKTKRNFQVEFSSLGFEHHAKYLPDLLEEKTISLAIECGSEELRNNIGKHLSNEKIIETINFYVQKGIKKFNLYFMIGLPNETSKDIEEYIKFSINLAQKYQTIKFNHIISTFIPKPATPYEREKRQNNATLKEYLEKIKKIFTENGIDTSMPILNNDYFNTLVSLGDRRVGYFLQHIFEKNIPIKNILHEYKRFMKKYNEKIEEEEKIPHYTYYCNTLKTKNQLLPWEFIEY